MEGGFWQCGRLSGFAKATERASQLKEIMKASVITPSCRRCTPSRAFPSLPQRQAINALVTQAVNKLANNSNAIVEYIDGTIMPDYDRFVENGVQYRDDAAYVNTTMDHFEEKARNLQQIMEKTVDSIRDISTAIEESANSVGNAASSTTVLVSNIDTVHSEMETNQSISDRLKGEAGRFKNV